MATGTIRYTVEEFDRLVEQPQHADRLLEYIGGEVIEVVSNNYASMVASKINFFIQLHLAQQRIAGYVTGADGGYQVAGERYIPDVAFVSKIRQAEPSRQAFNPVPPDLAVEVLSPSNQPLEMRIKIANYLAAGTVVWVVNPDTRTVEVYTPGQKAQKVGPDDVLEGGTALPGFCVAVSEFFPQ